MKIENEGRTIVLERNDKIEVRVSNAFGKITLENINRSIKIDGDHEVVDSINGDKMLEKVHIPVTITREEQIKKCDEWLSLFKKSHDTFKKIVFNGKYIENGLQIRMYFPEMGSHKGIQLELDTKSRDSLIDGPTIFVNEENEGMFNYLLASTLAYILNSDFKDDKIDTDSKEKEWNGIIQYFVSMSNKHPQIVINFSDNRYNYIVMALIGLHNAGLNTKPLIEQVKRSIVDDKDDEIFNEYFDFSKENYTLIKSLNQK